MTVVVPNNTCLQKNTSLNIIASPPPLLPALTKSRILKLAYTISAANLFHSWLIEFMICCTILLKDLPSRDLAFRIAKCIFRTRLLSAKRFDNCGSWIHPVTSIAKKDRNFRNDVHQNDLKWSRALRTTRFLFIKVSWESGDFTWFTQAVLQRCVLSMD